MELVYLRFDSYDFESDQRFQDGRKLLHESNNSDGNRLKDMKLFYYNRFVEPIDQTGYKQWSSASPAVTKTDCRVGQQDQETPTDSDCETKTDCRVKQQDQETPTDSDCETKTDCRVKQQDQETPTDSDCETSKNQAAETSAETEVTQLSFDEVMQLIQEGKEVPGAIKLDIKPSNQSPTPSQMERKLKPWEKASPSK